MFHDEADDARLKSVVIKNNKHANGKTGKKDGKCC